MEVSISRIAFKVSLDGYGEAEGEFIRFLSPRTVDALLRLLPLQGRVAVQGAQIYFDVPLRAGYEKAVSKVEKGDIGYWPIGGAICIFKEKMQPYSPVNLVGRITSGLDVFLDVKIGTRIRLVRV